jgi:hypothetical protein
MPLPAPDLKPQGWTLESAEVAPFHHMLAGRCDFVHDKRHATLLSMPPFAFMGARDGFTYDVIVDHHPISGFVTSSGVYCIVGDADAPLDQIVALRKALHKS